MRRLKLLQFMDEVYDEKARKDKDKVERPAGLEPALTSGLYDRLLCH
jgi:hypothetical protein